MKPQAPDWTEGGKGVRYQCCGACGQKWAFRREFCPGCGSRPPQDLAASGCGEVHAITRVERAPDDDFRALVPYAIVLVDLREGVRIMAHGALDLQIGDPVQLEMRLLAGRPLPYFYRDQDEQ